MSFDSGVSDVSLQASEAAGQVAQQALSSSGILNSNAPASSVTFSSLSQLQTKYPQLYNVLIQSMAIEICDNMAEESQNFVNTIKAAEGD